MSNASVSPRPDRLLRLPQVLEIVPVSKSTWWLRVKEGRYPKPVKLSRRCTAWKMSDVMALLENGMKEGGE